MCSNFGEGLGAFGLADERFAFDELAVVVEVLDLGDVVVAAEDEVVDSDVTHGSVSVSRPGGLNRRGVVRVFYCVGCRSQKISP